MFKELHFTKNPILSIGHKIAESHSLVNNSLHQSLGNFYYRGCPKVRLIMHMETEEGDGWTRFSGLTALTNERIHRIN